MDKKYGDVQMIHCKMLRKIKIMLIMHPLNACMCSVDSHRHHQTPLATSHERDIYRAASPYHSFCVWAIT